MGDLLYTDLVRRLASASRDELRVMERVYRRLERGRPQYGELVIAGDPRNWQAERFEERLDALVYDVIAELAEEDAAHAAERAKVRAEPFAEIDFDRAAHDGGGEGG